MRHEDETDYIAHEYYRQTGRHAGETLESLIAAVRFLRLDRKPRKLQQKSKFLGKKAAV